MKQKLLITDLDNTLYDWVTFFALSFRGMVEELTKLLDVTEEQILDEFRAVHQRYGNSEQPFAALELPSLQRKFPRLSRAELARIIDPALHRFNSIRKRTLALYPGTAEALDELTKQGVKIVGHTEAILVNAYWRLRSLGVDRYFSRLYTLEGKESIHISEASRWIDPPPGFVTVLPREERKPNPALIADICRHEGIEIASSYYLGDSMVRDVAMANKAGVTSIWARYGSAYDPSYWAYLVKITHWTDEDVRREKHLKSKYVDIVPDHIIDSPSELVPILRSEAVRVADLKSIRQ
jgi:FMN phosphatase YigB (HAD superfamily)